MKKKLIIIIAAVLVLAVAAAVFFLMPKKIVTANLSVGEAFVVNILDSDMLAKVPVTLVINEKATEELTANNAQVRDCILGVLRRQTEEVYRSADMQKIVQQQIRDELNALFPSEEAMEYIENGQPLPEGFVDNPKVIDVLFTDFVIN